MSCCKYHIPVKFLHNNRKNLRNWNQAKIAAIVGIAPIVAQTKHCPARGGDSPTSRARNNIIDYAVHTQDIVLRHQFITRESNNSF